MTGVLSAAQVADEASRISGEEEARCVVAEAETLELQRQLEATVAALNTVQVREEGYQRGVGNERCEN